MNNDLPLKPVADETPPSTPAPPWLALIVAWLGLFTLIASTVLLLLPGTHHPRAELEHAKPYSLADRFFPVPVYLSVVTLFLAIVVLRQMRHEPRPLPAPLVAQRVQAWAGIVLSLIAIVMFYAIAAYRVRAS